jgi:RNA polymerase sigma factor (sigma-70 family)
MDPVVTQPAAAPPDDPVREALVDTVLREELLKQALAVLGRCLPRPSAADRVDRADEALQETYVRALQRRATFDPTRSVGAWLHGIMIHVLSELTRPSRRSSGKESLDAGQWEQLAIDLAPAAADAVPNRLDATAYLMMLPPEHREVLQLRFYEGLSHDEIARRLGIGKGNARVRLCRALSYVKAIAGVAPREDRP